MYVIVCVFAPAVNGLNNPLVVFIIPEPDHTPPGVAAVRVWKPAFVQKGPTSLMVALGALLTVKLKEIGVPTQAPCEGVAVMVEIVCVVTWLAVKVGIVPVPEAPMPVAVLLFVQATVAVGLLVVHVIAGTVAPSQKTLDAGVVIVGAGLTIMLKLLAVPLHVPK